MSVEPSASSRQSAPPRAPLPPPLSTGVAPVDEVVAAWRRVVSADAEGDPSSRAEARIALVDAWLAHDAVAPAAELLRQVESIEPRRVDAALRRAEVLLRSAQLREWAQQRVLVARRTGEGAHWVEALRAWVRADELGEASACATALSRIAPPHPLAERLIAAVARLRAGVDVPAATLIERAHRARQIEDVEGWRALSVDAWVESRGEQGGELLVEALVASSRPRAAVYVAIETAARSLARSDGDRELASQLLVRAARLAESAAMLGEATAAWSLAALMPGERRREAREALRDLLAERGREAELARRLRVDAHRAEGSAAAAAWKGVAAVELPTSPTLAVQALLRAFRIDPDDHETLELLSALSDDVVAEAALRDGLWEIARSEVPRVLRVRSLEWVGALEERAGDPSSALLAWASIDEPRPELFESIARVHDAAEAIRDDADAALALVEAGGEEQGALEALLDAFSSIPGAFADFRAVNRTLGPLASSDERVASLWFRIALRRGTVTHRVAVARRIAAVTSDDALRARAVQLCLDATSEGGRDGIDAAELVSLLLDARPDDPELAATLAGIAEQSGDPALLRDALEALARSAPEPFERDVLARFASGPLGTFAVFASGLADPAATAERAQHLGALIELVGDSATLLARHTRALLSQLGRSELALEVARRFASFDPLSAEATIAWFGAANLAGDVAQIVDACAAMGECLTTQRDLTAVMRTAVARLLSLSAAPRAGRVALFAARAGALADRGLRAAVTDLATRLGPDDGARLLEGASAVADNAAEQITILRQLATRYAAMGIEGAELGVWQRAEPLLPNEALQRLLELAPRVGDRVWNARLLSRRLDQTLEPAARRDMLLAIAAEYAATDPPCVVDAMAALDRLAMEQRDPDVREAVVRAMLSLAQTDAAIGRISRWAAEQTELGSMSELLMRAARLADEGLSDPQRALALLRGLLRSDPGHRAALELAEEIALRSRSPEAMHAIYVDLLDRAAGPHGRRAISYRRAVFQERAGDDEGALGAFAAMFDASPGVGAPLTSLERIARRLGRVEVILSAQTRIADASPAGVAKSRAMRRAAEVARGELGDHALALQLEQRAHEANPSVESADALRALANAERGRAASTAAGVIEALVDGELARGNQSWDDDSRRVHALRALELAVADGNDPFRVAAAVGLFLREHPEPEAGVAEVTTLVERAARDDAMRAAAIDAPAMRAARQRGALASSNPPPPEHAAQTDEAPPPSATSAPPDTDGGAPSRADEAAPAPPADEADPTAWTPSSPPRTNSAHFDVATLSALRSAASHGNDAAASVLASRLSSSHDLRDEALAVQRRRFHEDPSRLDALESMIALSQSMNLKGEVGALTQLLISLEGRNEAVIPPELVELSDPPDGVAKIVFPARLGRYPELGAMLWEVIAGTVRREFDRARFLDARPVTPNSVLGRQVSAALKLLQLPRATALSMRQALDPLWALDPTTAPPTVVLSDAATQDADQLRWTLGGALEATRFGHLPISVFSPLEAKRWVQAVIAAFGDSAQAQVDPAVRVLAGRLLDGIPARSQRAITELVAELGAGLRYESWRDAVVQARAFAGLLVCGSFEVAATQLIGASPQAGMRPAQLIAQWEPLRELARFAASEEYVLLRWSVSDARRRR